MAVGGTPSAPTILDRRRIELIERGIPRQPYHASEELDLPKAEKIISRSLETATRLAQKAVTELIGTLAQQGYKLGRTGLVLASGRPLPGLAQILASHALIHTAEGELFRNAISAACQGHDLNVLKIPERDLPTVASDRLATSWESVQKQLVDLGKPMGAPWGQDQKQAALVAWLALSGKARAGN